MRKFVKYNGTEHLSGMYMNTGLTKGNYYEISEVTESGIFVSVINDFGEVEFYCVEIFE